MAYIKGTIKETNPSTKVDVGLKTSQVGPRRVRPVQWQIKGLSNH